FATISPEPSVTIAPTPEGYFPDVYLVNDARGILPGRYAGVDDLVKLMGAHGFKWHRSQTVGRTSGPDGMIRDDAVVLIKVNGQWAQRGGTNTDVLRGVIRRIVEHPDGFAGEIIVADNGQGSGSHNRSQHNAENRGQSPQDVVDDFVVEGWTASTYLWDDIRYASVREYSDGDMASGYIVNPILDPQTRMRVSYPKFQSAAGTYVSYKNGIWSPQSETFDFDKLVVINIPVFKTHSIYAITAAVKNHMGVVTRNLSTDSHSAIGRGGLGSVLAEVRMPDVTILDCIWILARPGSGPGASYSSVNRRDQLLASVDPVALDVWATKFIMIPQIIENGYSYSSWHNTQDPDNPDGTFRRYLDRSMNELLAAQIPTTNDYNVVDLHTWDKGDLNCDGQTDALDIEPLILALFDPDEYERRYADCDINRGDMNADGLVDALDIEPFLELLFP
ncbi:MAG: DUF362 domain-containing protein, partial [Planctomycetes bacterium]|nr:DUF362 domain-containing protein [Planctomycetota bacterium]